MEEEKKPISSWLDRPLSSILPKWNVETLIIVLILIVAIVSRFYNLDLRVMSHDEVNHVVPSYEFFSGNGYRHDPVTHGPFQFHMVALSYFLFGDSDFSSRVPAALFSIAAVAAVLLCFRRYLGRTGTLVAGFLFLISPFMLFYGRYTRNEAFIELFGVLTLYGILRYLDKGDRFSLFLLAAVSALNFATKETAYIYTAQLLLFVGVIFLEDVARAHWSEPKSRGHFLRMMVAALVLLMLALGFAVWNASLSGAEAAVVSGQETALAAPAAPLTVQFSLEVVALLAAVAAAVFAVVLMMRKLGWKEVRTLRSFDLLVLVGTLVLPLLSAFPVKIIGWDPLDYSSAGLLHTSIFVILFFAISIAIGLWWRRELWVGCAVLFYGIFTVFYTTFFTNGQGFFTGLVGALGYWLAQQGVQRGSQPLYYYALVEIPIYEYLAALGTILAVYFGIRYRRFATMAGFSPAHQPLEAEIQPGELTELAEIEELPQGETRARSKLPVLSLLLFWSLTSLVAYSYAGEKMPWLTVHIALPLLLTAGWGLGYLIDIVPWKQLLSRRGLLTLILLPIFLISLSMAFAVLLGNTPPFQGKTLDQLQATSTFLISVIASAASFVGILYFQKGWKALDTLRLVGVAFFALLTILTIRTSYRASYINYDDATEYLVYAHAASGPKEILAQVEEISQRLTGGKNIKVAYDNDGLYPYWWYFRDYPNKLWYTDNPTRELEDYPLIIASDTTAVKLDSIVKNNYIVFDYTRLWWPNQDYFNLTWDRLWFAISNPDMRSAIFNIWLNRDYSQYAELTGNQNLTLESWQPSSRLKFYVRKDVAAMMWDYGTMPAASETLVEEDPYVDGQVALSPDLVVGTMGTEPGQLQAPRGMASAPDGSLYVADSRNNRIQHFDANGVLLASWGSFADATAGNAPGGTFNEPWGIAVAPDGSVYVADTWNHRIQKFTADGEFVRMWGYFGQAETPDAFWGPRDVVVDSKGNVYVTDTGNKRIVGFDADGNYVTQFGQAGIALGDLDEPVGLAIDAQDNIYVADTWNKRVQIFTPLPDRLGYVALKEISFYGWFGQSLENKAYLAVDANQNIYITDPEGYRVVELDQDGNFIRAWGNYSAGTDGFGLASGVMVDPAGHVWVSDGANNRLLRFSMP